MAARKGRTAGFVMGETHRRKIVNSNILKALIEHAEGTREMSSSQVTAAIGLMRKVLPDLAQTTLVGDPKAPIRHSVEITVVDPG